MDCPTCNKPLGWFERRDDGPYLWLGVCYHCKAYVYQSRAVLRTLTFNIKIDPEAPETQIIPS